MNDTLLFIRRVLLFIIIQAVLSLIAATNKIIIIHFKRFFVFKKENFFSELSRLLLILHFALFVLLVDAVDVQYVVAADQHLTEIAWRCDEERIN